MVDTTLRHCCVCKQEYKFCPKCPEYQHLEPWHFSFCSENCRNIYNVTSKYENGQISDIDAKQQIQRTDLSRVEDFGYSYKNSIAKIMSVVDAKKKVEITKEPADTVYEKDEKKSVENSFADDVSDDGIIKKSRKKRISKDVE